MSSSISRLLDKTGGTTNWQFLELIFSGRNEWIRRVELLFPSLDTSFVYNLSIKHLRIEIANSPTLWEWTKAAHTPKQTATKVTANIVVWRLKRAPENRRPHDFLECSWTEIFSQSFLFIRGIVSTLSVEVEPATAWRWPFSLDSIFCR